MKQYPGNHYNFVCRVLPSNFKLGKVMEHRKRSFNFTKKRARVKYNAYRNANPIINFEKCLESFFSNPNLMMIGFVREHRTTISMLMHFDQLLNLYINGNRKSTLIYTIDHFIVHLNTFISEGKFTIKELPTNMFEKLTKIIISEPPLLDYDGEPFIFHKLVSNPNQPMKLPMKFGDEGVSLNKKLPMKFGDNE